MRDLQGYEENPLSTFAVEGKSRTGVSSAQTLSSSPPRERERPLTRLYTFAKNDWKTSLFNPSWDPSAGISSINWFRRAYESASYCSNSRARSSSR